MEIRAQNFTKDTNDLIGSIFKRYIYLCDENNFQCNMIDVTYFDNFEHWKSIVLKINGVFASELLKSDVNNLPSIIFELVSVAIYPEIDTSAVSIAESDMVIEYFRKENVVDNSMVHHTDCCVKLTHLPTGIVVRCQDDRSRTKNYIEALSLLKSKLTALSNSQLARKLD
jgi:peptide chain release factor 1